MKRNMQLIEKILVAVEESPEARGGKPIEVILPDHTPEEVNYHILLLVDAGFLKEQSVTPAEGAHLNWGAKRLTWQGHEYLDEIKRRGTWNPNL